MKTKLYNLEGKEVGLLELDDAVFGVAAKPTVVHQVLTAQAANQRQPWADTKTKGEVRGGGKKPWAQKGTGRARHGSIRSPIWKGGGVTFGPLSIRNYKTKINRQTRRLAARMCLSDKAKSGALLAIENFAFENPKTKLFAAFLKKLPAKAKSFLVVTAEKDEKVLRMTRNLPNVKTTRAADLNVMDLLSRQAMVADKAALAKATETLKKK